MNSEHDITRLLERVACGDKKAEGRLAEIVYPELRRIASSYMRSERSDHTLQATAVVNEAFLRFQGSSNLQFKDRSHFFCMMAAVMRRVLVDHARGSRAEKRTAYATRIPLDEALAYVEDRSDELLALDEALNRLAQWDERQARVVEMRFFAGIELAQIALVLGVSPRTVKRDFRMARAWLHGELGSPHQDGRKALDPS